MRLIDADMVLRELKIRYPSMPLFKELREKWAIRTEGYIEAGEIIMNAPTIDAVEVVRGKWIDYRTHGLNLFDCSRCRCHANKMTNYCPNCGARMKGADDGDK